MARVKINKVELFNKYEEMYKQGIPEKEIKLIMIENSINSTIDRVKLESNQRILRKYHKELTSGIYGTLKPQSIRSIFYGLTAFINYIDKDCKKATRNNFTNYLNYLQKKGLKFSSINRDIPQLKRFYAEFLKKPKVVAKLKLLKVKIRKDIKDIEILTPEDIKNMLVHCTIIRSKALLAVTYETGARISEIMDSNLGDLTIYETHALLHLAESGKTADSERVQLLYESLPYLKAWLNMHPNPKDPNAPLFTTLNKHRGARIKYRVVRDIFNLMVKKAGINKKMHPHLLRHSILTKLSKESWNEIELRKFAGWSKNSMMSSVYCHVGQDHIHNKMKLRNNIPIEKDETKNDDTLKPIICSVCNALNMPTNVYCGCGNLLQKGIRNVLNRQELAESLIDEFLNNPEHRESFRNFVRKKTSM